MLVVALYMYVFRVAKQQRREDEEDTETPPAQVRIATCEEYARFKLESGGTRTVEPIIDEVVVNTFRSYKLSLHPVSASSVLAVKQFVVASERIPEPSEEQKRRVAEYFKDDECPIVIIPCDVAAALVRRFGPRASSETIGAFYGLKRLALWTPIEADMDIANNAFTAFAWVTKQWTPLPVSEQGEEENHDHETATEPDETHDRVQPDSDEGSFKTVEGTSYRVTKTE